MRLYELLKYLQLPAPFEADNPVITSIENDSRSVQQGSLFICIKGYTVDGHDFAAAAVKNGAAAIISERQLNVNVPVMIVKDTVRAMAVLSDAFYGQPTRKLKLIGVTGTNGKTTVTHLLERIFAKSGKKTGLIGTIYTKINNKKLPVNNTTPDSLTLQKYFHKMVHSQVEIAAMEVSSHALDLGRVLGCDFDVAVFTNLTQDHLDYHRSMEEYLQAKSLLFSRLGNVYDQDRPKFAVLNADDAASLYIRKSTAAHIITYGIDQEADILAKNIQFSLSGTQFDLFVRGAGYKVNMKLIGKFSVYNVLASIAAALVCGMPAEEAIEAIEEINGVAGRFEQVCAGQDFTVVVDYAHTPDSLENVLKTIRHIAKARIFVIIGCGGDRDRSKRPIMARIACQYGTDPIFTSDNPRSEDPLMIIKDMEAGVSGEKYKVILDRREAISYAIKQAAKDDVIVIAGKGHETYQIIGRQIYEFDDRIVARELIEGR